MVARSRGRECVPGVSVSPAQTLQSTSFSSSSSSSRPLVLAGVAEGGSPEAQAGQPEPSHTERCAASPGRARGPRAEVCPERAGAGARARAGAGAQARKVGGDRLRGGL